MPYRLSGHFYATPVITEQTPDHRCPIRRLLLWVGPKNLNTQRRATTGDLCLTSDGFWIATPKFRRLYDEGGLEGADFLPLSSGQFIFPPSRRIRFHGAGEAKVAHGDVCSGCGNPGYHLATRMYLALDSQDQIGDREAVLGSCDFIMEIGATAGSFFTEDVLVGDGFAAAMRGKRLKGLAFTRMISPEDYDRGNSQVKDTAG